ncbi:MAG TPA: M20/M25/M40 family metallo-hydrolase [Vicinamibacterales bacterium]|nr:M20/M25/M40 family metallo-hydrolase [Vicinamibacterales bacterium]
MRTRAITSVGLMAVLVIGFQMSSRAQATDQSPAERVDSDIMWQIRREATDHSQIMRTLHYLTDVYGPRLTGSPNLRQAQDWLVQQATAAGLKNAHLEEWDFGHPGWLNEKTSVYLVAPVKDSLVVEALAWTPGTTGTITASTVIVTPPTRPTQADADAFFKRLVGNLKGRAVMIGQPESVAVSIDPPAKRRDDNDARRQFSPNPPPSPFAAPAATPAAPADPKTAPLTADQFQEQLNVFLRDQGAALRVNDAGRQHGQIRAFNNRTFDIAKAVPTVVMRNEDYGRIARLMASGHPVQIEATIVNETYPDGKTQHNVIAEIPGTDKAQEVVMLGGHLDSWHAATGATDNAIGVSTMYEAIRILQAIGATPRRTIRLALWSGEEQGLRGSVAYVAQHFGTFENPKPEYEHFAGYFNIDSGTGKARGMTVFGPPTAADVLRPVLAPFEGNGVMGANATRSRARGGSDHTSFNEIGLPGISVGQDPIEYGTHTWHTNLDTYERIIESDAQMSAMAIASAVYHLAMRDDKLPRFTKDTMPARPGAAPAPARPTAQP